MATNSFLDPQEWAQAQKLLAYPPPLYLDLFSQSNKSESSQYEIKQPFSEWLGEIALKKYSKLEGWYDAQPIALGSWARGELCPSSDIDLLFIGQPSAIGQIVTHCHEQGWEFRYRVPLNLEDWTLGVHAFDILALFHARALTAESERALRDQQELLINRGPLLTRKIIKEMNEDRKKRKLRYDSMSNFLEPNIKFGPGGLRDLQQIFSTLTLFSTRDFIDSSVVTGLLEIKNFLLTIRQKLHLSGAGDILSASDQKDLGQWLKLESPLELMRTLQKCLAEVTFFLDYVMEKAQASPKSLSSTAHYRLTHVKHYFSAIKRHPQILMQYRIRHLWAPFSSLTFQSLESSQIDQKFSARIYGKHLHSFFGQVESENQIDALFGSFLIDRCIHQMGAARGLVQHDQYHKFTLDAHLRLMLKELIRIRKKPRLVGALKSFVQELSKRDWKILFWAALYHDLGKGKNKDSSHSQIGAEYVRQDLSNFGVSPTMKEEIAWLVEHHLLLSQAAFRKNPYSSTTWGELADRHAVGARLTRLCVLTIADIRATNPDAWNLWKQNLLFEVMTAMRSGDAQAYLGFLEQGQSVGVVLSEKVRHAFDPGFLSVISHRLLLQDYLKIQKIQKIQKIENKTLAKTPASFSEKSSIQVWKYSGRVKKKKGQAQRSNLFWVRFHCSVDRAGLFVEWVSKLFHSGCSVYSAWAHTLSDFGAYDWFLVHSSRPLSSVHDLLLKELGETFSQRVLFSSIECVHQGPDEWIVSFRGRDQRGALYAAAQALTNQKLDILWAHIHTWGNQIDDVFGVRSQQSIEKPMSILRSQLL